MISDGLLSAVAKYFKNNFKRGYSKVTQRLLGGGACLFHGNPFRNFQEVGGVTLNPLRNTVMEKNLK